MICEITKAGKGFRGCLNYVFDDGKGLRGANPEIVASNMNGLTPRELAREFAFCRERRPEIEKPVAHLILNVHPRDGRLGAARWGMIVSDFMAGMGFAPDHQYVAGNHGEKAHDHVHIVASRISAMTGKVWDSSNDRRRAQKVCAELEKKYGLSPGALGLGKNGPRVSKREFAAAERQGKGKKPPRVVIHDRVKATLTGKPSLTEFRDGLAREGIEVRAHLDQSGQAIRGLSFAMAGSTFSGFQLSKSLGWAKLKQQLRDPDGPPPDWARFPTDGAILILDRVDQPTAASKAKAAILARRYRRRIEAEEVRHIRWARLRDAGLLELVLTTGTRIIELNQGTRIELIGEVSMISVQELVLAAQRGQWTAMKLSGPPGFQRLVLIEACRAGIRIVNPELQAEQARLKAEQVTAQAMETPAAVSSGGDSLVAQPSNASLGTPQRRVPIPTPSTPPPKSGSSSPDPF